MGTTAKGLWYPDGTDNIAPLHPHLAAMQTSVDNWLSTQAEVRYFANTAARDAAWPTPGTGWIAVVGVGVAQQVWKYSGALWETIDWTQRYLGGGVNLDTVVTPGLYHQNSGADAATGSNYPENTAGTLEVIQKSSTVFVQIYTIYFTASGSVRIYYRGSVSGTWMPWKHVGGLPLSVTLSSLFINGTPAGAPTAYLDNGWVQLDGGWQMAAGTSPVTPAISYNTSTIIFNLPTGYRPTKQQNFASSPFGSAAQVVPSVRVDTNGDVRVWVNNGGSGTTTAVMGLTAVRFRAA